MKDPLTSDTNYQSTVGPCVDMAPPARFADTHFGPYKNTSIIDCGAYDAKSVCAKQRPRGLHESRRGNNALKDMIGIREHYAYLPGDLLMKR